MKILLLHLRYNELKFVISETQQQSYAAEMEKLRPWDIESCKRHYRNLFLQQCLVVTEDGMDEEGYEDTRGKKTLQSFKTYSIKDAIYNWAEAWKKVPLSTLRNAWCKILKTPKTPPLPTDFEGFGAIEEEEVEDWVSEDQGLLGYHHLTEEEIAEELTTPEPPADEDDDEEAEAAAPGPSISAGIEATDTLLALADHGVLCMVKNYDLLRIMRLELMREVQQRKTQTKISDFFKAAPSPVEKMSRTESETSSVSVTSTSSTNLPNVSSGSSSSLLQDIPYTPEPPFNELRIKRTFGYNDPALPPY
ncbi:Uncharacterized protein FKW44_013518, partial [Caligus rogercresseyi]